jgi:hypothetical protein
MAGGGGPIQWVGCIYCYTWSAFHVFETHYPGIRLNVFEAENIGLCFELDSSMPVAFIQIQTQY